MLARVLGIADSNRHLFWGDSEQFVIEYVIFGYQYRVDYDDVFFQFDHGPDAEPSFHVYSGFSDGVFKLSAASGS